MTFLKPESGIHISVVEDCWFINTTTLTPLPHSPTSFPHAHHLYAIKYKGSIEMDSIPEEDSSGVEITVGMLHALPPVKYHDGPLQFLSKSQLSAKEYEKRLSAASSSSSEDTYAAEEDMITIRCSNGNTVEPFLFRIAQSALSRSPIFNTFFKSDYYAPSSDMLITFMVDPAAVFDLVKRYLEEGPDLLDLNHLRLHVYRRYNIIERETVLVRLARMAHNMGLNYLHEMVYEILLDESRFITAQVLPLLAGLIFAPRGYYHPKVKEWCLVNIGHHFLELKTSRQWANCLRLSDPALRAEWRHMSTLNDEILYTYENISDEQILERKIHRMSFAEQDRVISYLGEKRAQDAHNTELIRSGRPVPKVRDNHSNHEEEWEDVRTPFELEQQTPVLDEPFNPRTSPIREKNGTASTKAMQLMGMYEHSDIPGSPRGNKKLKRRRGKISSLLGSPKEWSEPKSPPKSPRKSTSEPVAPSEKADSTGG